MSACANSIDAESVPGPALDMTGAYRVITLSPRDYDAVLFDLDGVLDQDGERARRGLEKAVRRFSRAARSAGQASRSFPSTSTSTIGAMSTASRATTAWRPFSSRAGSNCPRARRKTVPMPKACSALGNLKDKYFLEHLEQHGVEPYEAAIALVRSAAGAGDQDRRRVLQQQLRGGARGGGHRANCSTRGWTGRTSPASGSRASRRRMRFWRRRGALGVEPSRAVVVEDAIAGVEAGRAGRFGCVIGVDRGGQSLALREAGADVVVTDLAQVQVAAEPPSAWSLVFEGFDPAHEGIREALCTLGNGYFATRGAAAWAVADDIHYPGTYLAGGYNRLRTDIAGRMVENEDLVNFPNWLALDFRIADAGLVRCEDRHAPVIPPGTRSAARHAVADASASKTGKGDAACCRSGAWSRWATCTWVRWNWR